MQGKTTAFQGLGGIGKKRASQRLCLGGQCGRERAHLCSFGRRRMRRDVAGNWYHCGQDHSVRMMGEF